MKKVVVVVVILAAIVGFSEVRKQSQAQDSSCYTDESIWENLEIGCRVYTRVFEVPPAVYLEPNDAAEQIVNNQAYPAAGRANAYYYQLNKNAQLWVEKVNNEWVEIQKTQRLLSYTGDERSVYVQTHFLEIILPSRFEPIGPLKSPDKLIVVQRDDPTVYYYEGSKLILKSITYVNGTETNVGDQRTGGKTTISYGMEGLNGVGWFISFNQDGDGFHEMFTRNFSQAVRGGYGTNGCVNLPGHEWYEIPYRGELLSVAEFIWRVIIGNDQSIDPTDQEHWYGNNGYTQRVYQAVDAVRVIVVNSLYDLYNYPLTYRFGGEASSATLRSWDEIIRPTLALGTDWSLPNYDDQGNYLGQIIYPGNVSKAELEGTDEEDPFVMLRCSDRSIRDDPAYPGSSRTVGQVCDHLEYERQGSICTPERVDLAYLGKKVLCNSDKFYALSFELKIELRQHENVHLIQFSPGTAFNQMIVQGVIAADDPSPNYIDANQPSVIGITELAAQRMNVGSQWENDYLFTLVEPTGDGGKSVLTTRATTEEAWSFLHRQCGDPTGIDSEMDALLTSALYGNPESYAQLTAQCGLPLHELIPDRTR